MKIIKMSYEEFQKRNPKKKEKTLYDWFVFLTLVAGTCLFWYCFGSFIYRIYFK